jgi:anti-sigma regulatory factor (Ser/Thr protein kinase)
VEVSRTESTAQALAVPDASAVGSARRAAAVFAESNGASEALAARVALVATELATNLVRHAGGGTLIVQRGTDESELELLALDRGPGIANLAEARRDGFSTAGTSGHGLGAVARMADGCDVFSTPGGGTVVLARFGGHAGKEPRAQSVTVGGVSLPYPGESVCGDAWAARAATTVTSSRPRAWSRYSVAAMIVG